MREKLRSFFKTEKAEVQPIDDVEGFAYKLKKFKSESKELS
jgi:hypothetical protein